MQLCSSLFCYISLALSCLILLSLDMNRVGRERVANRIILFLLSVSLHSCNISSTDSFKSCQEISQMVKQKA